MRAPSMPRRTKTSSAASRMRVLASALAWPDGLTIWLAYQQSTDQPSVAVLPRIYDDQANDVPVASRLQSMSTVFRSLGSKDDMRASRHRGGHRAGNSPLSGPRTA